MELVEHDEELTCPSPPTEVGLSVGFLDSSALKVSTAVQIKAVLRHSIKNLKLSAGEIMGQGKAQRR
jgi:hypothetical protein